MNIKVIILLRKEINYTDLVMFRVQTLHKNTRQYYKYVMPIQVPVFVVVISSVLIIFLLFSTYLSRITENFIFQIESLSTVSENIRKMGDFKSVYRFIENFVKFLFLNTIKSFTFSTLSHQSLSIAIWLRCKLFLKYPFKLLCQ